MNPTAPSTSGSQSTTPPANQSTTQSTTSSTSNTTQSNDPKQLRDKGISSVSMDFGGPKPTTTPDPVWERAKRELEKKNIAPVTDTDYFLQGFNSDYTDERPKFSTPITRASLWDDSRKELSHKGITETTADSARYKYITEYDPLFDDSSRDITVRALREKGITPIYDPFLEGFHADDKGNETVTTPEGRDPSPWDLIVNSFKYGYNDSARGQEAWKYMHGQENELDKYNELLSSDEYNFETDDWWEQMISGASQHLGQWIRQLTDPDTAALAIGSGSMALLGGQAGPQVLLPEEILTVPAAFTLGMKAGNAKTNMEIEGGRAYLKMLNNGVSEETARAIATGVGGVNAALETLQLDELLKAYKILDKVGADDKLTSIVFSELVKRGMDVGTETGQEVLQEAATIAGVQAGNKLDTGEWAYNLGEVGERLWDTAKESALTYGLTNIPSAVHNVTTLNHDRLVAAGEANIIAGKMPTPEQLRAMNMTEAEALGKMAVLQMGELDDAADTQFVSSNVDLKPQSVMEELTNSGGKVNKIPNNPATTGHIFRDAEGHIPDTPQNRALLEDVANSEQDFLGYDKYGNAWYTRQLPDGTFAWVEARNGNIFEGGINKTRKTWNPETGLKKP